MVLVLLLTVLFLAYANGANDNFKGVATLFGSRTCSYRHALWWATGTTFAGSMTAMMFAQALVISFSGKGLVPDVLVHDPRFLLAVAGGAAVTVMLATRVGLPISTTHALTGALVGAGLVAAGSVHLQQLGAKFVVPLAVSPFLSIALAGGLYPLFRYLRHACGVERQMCICVSNDVIEPIQMRPDGTAMLQSSGMTISAGQLATCTQRYAGRVVGIDAQWILDRLHALSAGAVCFARGLNDTPKIVALLLAAQALQLPHAITLTLVGVSMACGGLLHARRVATTMSDHITTMNHGQGFTANLSTALLVLCASRWGLPVSTTHVSCGSLFGLGAVTGGARWAMIRTVVAAWIVTLPLAAAAAAGVYVVL
jgi:inorganic phosphate transporter, PiT family